MMEKNKTRRSPVRLDESSRKKNKQSIGKTTRERRKS